MSNLILFGFKGCGKSYFAHLFAKRFGLSWVDTDHLIETCCGGISCREIYQKMGKEKFRHLESEVIVSLQKVSSSIISLGGGAILQEKNQLVLEKMGKLIYLKEDKKILKSRLLKGEHFAIFEGKQFENAFEETYEERLRIFEKIPSHPICLSDKSEDEILLLMKEILDGQ